MTQPIPLKVLFDSPSPRWGLRGDPFLWQALAERSAPESLPSSEEALIAWLEKEFTALTTHQMSEDKPFFVESFSHGGMSSGFIAPTHWREEIVPFLCARFQQASASKG